MWDKGDIHKNSFLEKKIRPNLFQGRLNRTPVKGEVFVVVVVVVVDFRGRTLELTSVLPRGPALERILRGDVRVEPGCTQIRPNNTVGDGKEEALTGLLQY